MIHRILPASAFLVLALGTAFGADTASAPAQDKQDDSLSSNVLHSRLPYNINLLDQYGPNGFNKDGAYADLLKVPKLDVPVTKEQATAQADAVDKLMPMLPAGYNGATSFPVDKNGNPLTWEDVRSGKTPLSEVFRVCDGGSRSCYIGEVDQMIKGLSDAPAFNASAAVDPKVGTAGGKDASADNVCPTPGCAPLSPKEIAEDGLQACDQVCPLLRDADGKPMALTQDIANPDDEAQVDALAHELKVHPPQEDPENLGTSGETARAAPPDGPDRSRQPDAVIGGGGTSGSGTSPGNPPAAPVPTGKPVPASDVPESLWREYAKSILSLLKTPFDASSAQEIAPENRVWYARDRMEAKDPGLKAWSQLNSAAEDSRAGGAPVDVSDSEDLLGADQLAAETGHTYDANAVARPAIPVRLRTKYNKPESSTLPFQSPAVSPTED